MVNQRTYPGWGYMVEKGATTCWEQWNGFYSQIHSCFPYIGGWFYRGLAGIQWDTGYPGFKNIILRPGIVKSVGWVNCSYSSSYGEIVSNWKLEDDSFIWDIRVPVNSMATVYMPAKDLKSISEGNKSISKSKGVTFLGLENERVVLSLESGYYCFVSSLK
jgi:alpha-L-rhamnosidase